MGFASFLVVKRRIDFMVAGNQKCGTTTLAARLDQHPGVRMAKPKELHWFSQAGFEQSESDYATYHEHGWGTTELDEGVVYGEATPKYVLHDPGGRPRTLERIAAYNPDLKLIVVFRDPVERAFSQWNMLRRNGRNPPPFAQVVSSSLVDRRAPHADVLRRGEYGRIASNILSLFPADNCCFIRTDDLDAKMEQICRFLGLSGISFNDERRAVGTYEAPLPTDLHGLLRRHFHEEVELLGQLTGLCVDDWLTEPHG